MVGNWNSGHYRALMTASATIGLETARLILRPLVAADLVWLTALFSDHRVTEYLATGRMTGAPARAFSSEFIENSISEFESFGCGAMAVTHGDNHHAFGYTGLRTLPDRNNVAELIYAFGPDYWRQGYGQEVAKGLLDWGFRRYPEMAEIIAMTRLENTVSIAVMKKSGMIFGGVNERYYGETLQLYSLSREAWEAQPLEQPAFK